MKKFSKQVDISDRAACIEFLTDHFRYDTMNSWNANTSYAHNVKIHNLGLDKDTTNKCYQLIELAEVQDKLYWLMEAFDRENDWQYQVGFNGRSNGYIVIRKGGRKPTGHMSYCKECGQRNFNYAGEGNNTCGGCGKPSRVNFAKPPMLPYTTGGSIDKDTDFTDWTEEEVLERVKLVQRFDQLADDMLAALLDIAENYDIQDEEYEVTHTARRKVLIPKEQVLV